MSKMDQSHGHLLGMPNMLPGDHRERDALRKDWSRQWRGLAGSLPTTGISFIEVWVLTFNSFHTFDFNIALFDAPVFGCTRSNRCNPVLPKLLIDLRSSRWMDLRGRSKRRSIQLSHPTINDVCSQVVDCLSKTPESASKIRKHLVSTCSNHRPFNMYFLIQLIHWSYMYYTFTYFLPFTMHSTDLNVIRNLTSRQITSKTENNPPTRVGVTSILILCRVQNVLQNPNPKSKLRNPKSQIRNPKSEIQNPKSKIRNPKSKIQNPKSEIQNPKSKIQNLHKKNCYIMPQNPKSEIQTPKSKIRNPKSKIRNPKSKIQNPKSKIQNPNSKIQNPNSKIQTPKSKIQNPNSKIQNWATGGSTKRIAT